jgi:hypothetical protein
MWNAAAGSAIACHRDGSTGISTDCRVAHVRLKRVYEPLNESQVSSDESFPLPDIDSNGIDRSQIRRQLALTPSERLQALEAFLASIILLRSETRKSSVSQDSPSAR